MVSRRTDRLFHKMTHHTNLHQPFTKYISGTLYPAQDSEKLGRMEKLKYRNKYIPDVNHISESPDEYEVYIGNDEFDGNIIEQDFIILRCDLTEPYLMIAMSEDYVAMIVGSSKKSDGEYTYQNIVHEYPKQIEEYLGLLVTNHYFPDTFITSVVLSCDSMEPCNSIIAELYNGEYVRFVTDFEVESIVMDRYDPDGLRDYNGKDAEGNIGPIYIDLDGLKPDYGHETLGTDANGGYPNPIQDIYRTDILSREEVLELRGRLLRERKIYGADYNVPTSVTISPKQINITPGENVELTAVTEPIDAIGRIFWKSDDPNIATVTVEENSDNESNNVSTAIVTGKLLGGTTTITAYTEFGKDAKGERISDKCSVSVIISVTGIDFMYSGATVNLRQGESFQIEASVIPDNATIKDLSYTSDNEWVLISDTGEITLKDGYDPKAEYIANITISSVSNPEIQDGFIIKYFASIVEPTNITLGGNRLNGPYHDNNSDKDFYFITEGKYKDIEETYTDIIETNFEPDNTNQTRIHWKLTDVSGQSVEDASIINTPFDSEGFYSEDGVLPGLSIETAETLPQGTRKLYKISGTSDNGLSNDVFISRGNPITGISWVDPGREIKGLETGSFKIKIDRLFNDYPISERGLEFISSDPSILRLGSLGEVHYNENYPDYFTISFETFTNGGIVTLTARTTEDYFGSFEDTMVLNIGTQYVPVQSISFRQPDDISIWTNKDDEPNYSLLEIDFMPHNATNREILFSKIDGMIPNTVSMDVVNNNSCKVSALRYDGGNYTEIKAVSVDNQEAIATKKVYSNTEYKEISIEDSIIINPFGNVYIMNINFLSNGYGGVNRELIQAVLDTAVLENNDCNLSYEFIDDWEGSWETVKVKFTSDRPGSATFKIHDNINDIWLFTEIEVGANITSITINGDLVDWSSYDVEDDVLIPIIVEPEYWGELVDDPIVVVDKPQFVTVDSIYSTGDDGSGFIYIHLNNVILENESITIKSTKNNVIGTYKFKSQVGTVKIKNIIPTFNDTVNTYHKTYYIDYELDPDQYYGTSLPIVVWSTSQNNIITLDDDYTTSIESLTTLDVTGRIPITVTSMNAATITLNYESQDSDHVSGQLELVIGKKMEEYNFNVSESDNIEYIEAENTILVKAPDSFTIEAYSEDADILNGLIDFSYNLPEFIDINEHHDDITYKPTLNTLQLDFSNMVSIGTANISVIPEDGIVGIDKNITIKYGNDILNAHFPESYNDFKIDITNQPEIKIFKLIISTEYPDFEPTSNCTWNSSNPNILDVDPNGYVAKDPSDNKYNFYTTYTLNDQLLTGSVTITAMTTKGSYSFNILVYDSIIPVEKDMLNIHEINMVYTTDPLEYQLSIIDGTTGTISWLSDKPSVATVTNDGLVNIIEVPSENEFIYYDQIGQPLDVVSLDFYIHVSVQTETTNYVDKCKIHIIGESKGIPTAKLIHDDSINVTPGSNNNIQFIGTPYYLKNNDDNDTITFVLNGDQNIPDPMTINGFNSPSNFDNNGTANVSFTIGDNNYINNIINEEFEFEELPNDNLNGDCDFDKSVPDFDYDLTELTENSHIPFPDMGTTPYDEDVINRQYTIHLNNPKNSYGIGVIDSTLNIHINQ